ncbi:MAG: fibronectin type III domain-containing protein [Anaerovoracaceae bacterium]|jgi:lysozyme
MGYAALCKESDTFYYATPEQLCKADAILTGVQAQIVTTEEEFSAKLKAKLGSDATLPAIYATDPKGVKKATVKSWKTTSGTFTKLKKGKKYYVRVRAYKKASGKTIYGSWSSKKTVKIRR